MCCSQARACHGLVVPYALTLTTCPRAPAGLSQSFGGEELPRQFIVVLDTLYGLVHSAGPLSMDGAQSSATDSQVAVFSGLDHNGEHVCLLSHSTTVAVLRLGLPPLLLASVVGRLAPSSSAAALNRLILQEPASGTSCFENSLSSRVPAERPVAPAGATVPMLMRPLWRPLPTGPAMDSNAPAPVELRANPVAPSQLWDIEAEERRSADMIAWLSRLSSDDSCDAAAIASPGFGAAPSLFEPSRRGLSFAVRAVSIVLMPLSCFSAGFCGKALDLALQKGRWDQAARLLETGNVCSTSDCPNLVCSLLEARHAERKAPRGVPARLHRQPFF